MPATHDHLLSRASATFGATQAARWSPDELRAWLGLRAAEHAVRDAIDTAVETGHGLSVSQLMLLGRLAGAEQRTMRLTALADDAGLSLSRVSRVAVALEDRGLLRRRPCPSDARAVNATLTEDGATLVAAAQETAHAAVRASLFAGLDADDVARLADILGRVAPDTPGQADCDTVSR
ncbi:MAG: MarR family winged helix-turn-helix transcriptional regulator [Solirubrobacteraceae bacterium]